MTQNMVAVASVVIAALGVAAGLVTPCVNHLLASKRERSKRDRDRIRDKSKLTADDKCEHLTYVIDYLLQIQKCGGAIALYGQSKHERKSDNTFSVEVGPDADSMKTSDFVRTNMEDLKSRRSALRRAIRELRLNEDDYEKKINRLFYTHGLPTLRLFKTSTTSRQLEDCAKKLRADDATLSALIGELEGERTLVGSLS